MGGVGVDVATELASHIRHGSENAARNDLAFDLGEPDLDLVEPRGIGRGEVKLKQAPSASSRISLARKT